MLGTGRLWILFTLLYDVNGQGKKDGQKSIVEANLKTKVDSSSDFFPYIIRAELELLKFDTGKPSYRQPGFAKLYRNLFGNFFMYLYPPEFCEAIYLCIFDLPQLTKKGLQSLDLKTACDTSLRFLTREQTVYNVKDGKATPYVYMLPKASFHTKGQDQQKYFFEAFNDFDNENVEDEKFGRVKIEFDTENKSALLLSSSPYCHTLLLRHRSEPVPLEIVKFEPNVDLSEFYKIFSNKKHTPYIVTNTIQGSLEKNKLGRSFLFDTVTKVKLSEEDCCPTLYQYVGFVESDSWFEQGIRMILTAYTLEKVPRYQKMCQRDMKTHTSALQSFRVEVGPSCHWLRLCFDKSDKWCENEGNALNMIFAHDVFIPTDSDQAIMFGVERKYMSEFRINFLIGEPGITLAYAFTSPNNPGISHTMQLQSYADVSMDPTKLKIHVLKPKNCQSRLLGDLADVHFGVSVDPPIQCINVRTCTCYTI
ncbi:hypothetical protein RB195_007355 [Necator americanus]|uniref:Uncharacterized protein n=1 Tax=Necator americanus TaxID=51031 RepID=A0ABR1BWY5_NECAM